MATWEIVASPADVQESRFLNLPVEIHEIIGNYLSIDDMLSLRSTCLYLENVYTRSRINLLSYKLGPYWYYYVRVGK